LKIFTSYLCSVKLKIVKHIYCKYEVPFLKECLKMKKIQTELCMTEVKMKKVEMKSCNEQIIFSMFSLKC